MRETISNLNNIFFHIFDNLQMWETNCRQNILLVDKMMLNNYWIKKDTTGKNKTNESYSG